MVEHEFSLGALIAKKRKLAGLTRKQLAEMCEYKNLGKGIRRIEEIEKGKVIEEITAKIIKILDISDEDREICHQKDAELLIKTKRKLPPFKPYILRRLMAAIYQPIPVPDGLTNDELITYSLKLCQKENLFMCLQLDYDLRYWMNPIGNFFVDRKFNVGPWAKPNIGSLISLV